MKEGHAFIVGLTVVVLLMAPAVGVADFFDDFSDGWWERDPNDPQYDDANYHAYEYTMWQYDANDANDYAHEYWTDANNAVFWDSDNPDWWLYPQLAASPLAQIVSDSVADNALRLACDKYFVLPWGSLITGVMSLDEDPNTSPTWWDDTTDHYILTWVYYTGYYHPSHTDPNKRYSYNDPNYDPNYDDPNDDKGRMLIIMHSTPGTMTGLVFAMDYDNNDDSKPQTQHANLQAFNFQGDPDHASANFKRIWIDPNHAGWASYPNLPAGCVYLNPSGDVYEGPDFGGVNLNGWERSGFWALFQFEQDPNYAPGDPNGKWGRGAIWHGDKYDWDGKWILQGEYGGSGAGGWGDGSEWYLGEGACFLAANSDDSWTNGFPAECAYDNVEMRTGRFSNVPRRLSLTVGNSHMGTVLIDPELADPNDPNTESERLLRYTDGTGIVLLGHAYQGKSFKQWVIFDPNHPGDSNHITIDSNAVLFLMMDADWEIEGSFKCGGSLPPFIAMTLLALALGVVVRRIT